MALQGKPSVGLSSHGPPGPSCGPRKSLLRPWKTLRVEKGFLGFSRALRAGEGFHCLGYLSLSFGPFILAVVFLWGPPSTGWAGTNGCSPFLREDTAFFEASVWVWALPVGSSKRINWRPGWTALELRTQLAMAPVVWRTAGPFARLHFTPFKCAKYGWPWLTVVGFSIFLPYSGAEGKWSC